MKSLLQAALLTALTASLFPPPAQAQPSGTVMAWGWNKNRQTNVPAGLNDVTAVAAGGMHTVALKSDGTVVAWGANKYGQSTVPEHLSDAEYGSDVTAIAAGYEHTVALLGDGTVEGWGEDFSGQATDVPANLSNAIAIAAGGWHTVALRSNGTVAAWGDGSFGQTSVPAGLNNVKAISAGGWHTVALRNNGTVVAWGDNDYGQTSVPAGLSGVIAIAAGWSYTVALKSDGTVVAWGDNDYGQTSVPAGLSGVIAIAAGAVSDHTLALKGDGTVVAWGANWDGQTDMPAGLDGVIAIAAGGSHTAVVGPPLRTLVLTPATRTVGPAGGNRMVNVTASRDWSWSQSAGSEWLTSSEAASQNGSQTFSYTVAPNPSTESRSATITMTSGALTATHVVTQAGSGTTTVERLLLMLKRSVPAAQTATPDKAGTLTLSAVPAKNATKLSKGPALLQTSQVLSGTSVKVTATAKKGHVFSHWSGLPAGAVEAGNVVTFTMPDEDADLTAHFIVNPFTTPELEPDVPNPFVALGAKPVFQGLLLPAAGTVPSNATAGHLTSALVAAKGSLSGKVFLDGKVTSFTGALQGDGRVWFKVGKILSDTLPLPDKDNVRNKALSANWSTDGLSVEVTAPGDAVSEGLAQPALYSKTVPAPAALLDSKGKQGYFTLALPTREPASPENAATYPQGTGYATLTLAKAGTLKLAGMLADGTKISASSFLVAGANDKAASPVFVALRTPGGKASEKDGSFLGYLVFDAVADSDVGGADWWWFRPVAKTKTEKLQAYRAGWPEGIMIDPVGALYDSAKPAKTALGLGAVDTASGNAVLEFEAGKLTALALVTAFNIDGNKVVKLDKADKSFTLSVVAKTGLIKGTFTPDWSSPAKKLPAFQGVLLQKGGNKGGWGFFLSNAAGDLDPESGSVTLGAPAP